jgi:hypothetical protein
MSARDMRRAAVQVLDKNRLDELSHRPKRTKNETLNTTTARFAPDTPVSRLSSVSETAMDRNHTGRSFRARNEQESISPDFSDQAQVGLTIMTPGRTIDINCGDSNFVSLPTDGVRENPSIMEAIRASASSIEEVRESLDCRLARTSSTDV